MINQKILNLTLSPSATWQITSPVDGFTVGKVFPDWLSMNSLLTKTYRKTVKCIVLITGLKKNHLEFSFCLGPASLHFFFFVGQWSSNIEYSFIHHSHRSTTLLKQCHSKILVQPHKIRGKWVYFNALIQIKSGGLQRGINEIDNNSLSLELMHIHVFMEKKQITKNNLALKNNQQKSINIWNSWEIMPFGHLVIIYLSQMCIYFKLSVYLLRSSVYIYAEVNEVKHT